MCIHYFLRLALSGVIYLGLLLLYSFVNDFLSTSWVYLLKDCIDALPSIHQFLQEISAQYSNTPKIPCINNALELVKTALQELCISHGILRQTTCPHTSHQNSVDESKHRHLLHMTCTLLVQMRVPHFMWFDALLAYVYLLNHLPSSPLGSEEPLHRLHRNHDLFDLPHGYLVVWSSFMIRLLIHPSSCHVLSKRRSSPTRTCKRLSGLFSRLVQVCCLY